MNSYITINSPNYLSCSERIIHLPVIISHCRNQHWFEEVVLKEAGQLCAVNLVPWHTTQLIKQLIDNVQDKPGYPSRSKLSLLDIMPTYVLIRYSAYLLMNF